MANNNSYTLIDDRFRKYLTKSFLFHLCLVIGLIVSSLTVNFFNQEKRKENIKIIESSVRVDMVAMPELTIKELKTMSLDENSDQHEQDRKLNKNIKDVSINPEKDLLIKKKKINFSDLIKKMAKKTVKVNNERVKKRARKSKVIRSKIDKNEIKKLILMGNKLKKGQNLIGTGTGGKDTFSKYLEQLPLLIKPYWFLPSYLLNQKLKCRIRIFLGSDGSLLRSEIYESSGNTEYDTKALKAVKEASPFPKLMEKIKKRGLNGDILLGFPL